MTTAIILPVWKRPEITELCFENLAKTGCKVFVATSEDWAYDLSNEYGFTTVNTDNKPLGRKKNILLNVALSEEWDQLLEIGSDNLLDLTNLNQYLSIPNDHYGVNCSYMVHPASGRAKFFKIGGLKRIWGAGRVISREAVEKAFPLWDDTSNEYLDAQANNALQKAGYEFSVVQKPMFVGIKSDVNIHSYDRFGGKPVTMDFMLGKFPELESLMNIQANEI